jgi:hypothetical protein
MTAIVNILMTKFNTFAKRGSNARWNILWCTQNIYVFFEDFDFLYNQTQILTALQS